MSKYIDSEKLIAEIERRKEKWLAESRLIKKGKDKAMYAAGKSSGYTEFLSIIDSLQQEQSFPRWIHANYSDKPEIRYTPSGTPYLQNGSYMIWLSDLDTLPKDGKDLTNPIQDQPEVDLEKEIEWEWVHREKQEVDFIECAEMDKEEFVRFARHFYELGQRAMRKRIMDPEYNRDVIEKMKTEYPVDESNARKEE